MVSYECKSQLACTSMVTFICQRGMKLVTCHQQNQFRRLHIQRNLYSSYQACVCMNINKPHFSKKGHVSRVLAMLHPCLSNFEYKLSSCQSKVNKGIAVLFECVFRSCVLHVCVCVCVCVAKLWLFHYVCQRIRMSVLWQQLFQSETKCFVPPMELPSNMRRNNRTAHSTVCIITEQFEMQPKLCMAGFNETFEVRVVNAGFPVKCYTPHSSVAVEWPTEPL